MTSISSSRPFQIQFLRRIRLSPHSLQPSSYLAVHRWRNSQFRQGTIVVKTSPVDGWAGNDRGVHKLELLRKPVTTPSVEYSGGIESTGKRHYDESEEIYREGRVDWEHKILEETYPLVGLARVILHSGRYEIGDRLSSEHEKIMLEKFLPYHPECEKKIACGVKYITIGYHPTYGRSRCLFIVREDGEHVDFSYWKCLKGYIKKNYPHCAESFILRHFEKLKRE